MTVVLAALVMGPAGSALADGLAYDGSPYSGFEGYGHWGPTMGCCGAGIDCHYGYPPPPNYSPICCFGYNPPSNYSPILWVSSVAETMHIVRMRLAGMGIHPTPLHTAPRREVAPPPTPGGDTPKKKIEEPEPKKDEGALRKKIEGDPTGNLDDLPPKKGETVKQLVPETPTRKPQSLPPPEM
jgi:hypothetical protein